MEIKKKSFAAYVHLAGPVWHYTFYVYVRACHVPIPLADSARAVCVGRGRFPSPAAAPDSAGRCGTVCVSPGEAAGSASSPQHPKPTSAAGLKSCPTHESPEGKKRNTFSRFSFHVVLSWDAWNHKSTQLNLVLVSLNTGRVHVINLHVENIL